MQLFERPSPAHRLNGLWAVRFSLYCPA